MWLQRVIELTDTGTRTIADRPAARAAQHQSGTTLQTNRYTGLPVRAHELQHPNIRVSPCKYFPAGLYQSAVSSHSLTLNEYGFGVPPSVCRAKQSQNRVYNMWSMSNLREPII